MAEETLAGPLLLHQASAQTSFPSPRWLQIASTAIAVLFIGLVASSNGVKSERGLPTNVVQSKLGVVATDDGRCSDIGVSILRQGGHAVDATIAAALCLGVVNPVSSGIGGGAFMVIKSSGSSKREAYDMRETAPLAASQDMYENNPENKSIGALSVAVPGELAGLHVAWRKHGRLPWKPLFQPAIKLARNGSIVSPYLANRIKESGNKIMADIGLRKVFAPNGSLLETGDTFYNIELAHTLEKVSTHGPKAFYNGSIGKKLVEELQKAGGILTSKDLQNYKVEVEDAMTVDTMGYTILGMHPPSSGTVGLSLVLNILDSYGTKDAFVGSLGLHRLIESMKYMFAFRMNLGDPKFVNITEVVSAMLSKSTAKELRRKILDNNTFPPSYYQINWSEVYDHGTSHLCIVDADRNVVSMTTTVNSYFGSGILSTSTGVLLNNEMDDFSTPTEVSNDKLPPAPANFIQPNKRPLSSMTPIIVLKDNQLAGVVGASGGIFIIPSVIQVFI